MLSATPLVNFSDCVKCFGLSWPTLLASARMRHARRLGCATHVGSDAPRTSAWMRHARRLGCATHVSSDASSIRHARPSQREPERGWVAKLDDLRAYGIPLDSEFALTSFGIVLDRKNRDHYHSAQQQIPHPNAHPKNTPRSDVPLKKVVNHQ